MKKFAFKLIKSLAIFLLFSLVACNTGLNGVSDREDRQSSAGSSDGAAYLSAVSFGAKGRTIVPNERFTLRERTFTNLS